MATTLPGVRPSISFASLPTATTSPLFLLIVTVDDQRRAWLGATADFHYVTMQLGGPDFQHHLLALALCRECKLERVACRTDVLLRIRGHHVPEVVARVESGYIRRSPRQLPVLHDAGEHRRRADSNLVAHRALHRLPFEMHWRMFRVRDAHGLQVQGLSQFRRGQAIRFY